MNYCCAAGNCEFCVARWDRLRRRRLREQRYYDPRPAPSKQNEIRHETVRMIEVKS